MKNLLEHCKAQFEYVIIDGPATLVSDSKTLASQVDGTIVVLNAQATHRGAGMRILRELRETQANLLGTVLIGRQNPKRRLFPRILPFLSGIPASSRRTARLTATLNHTVKARQGIFLAGLFYANTGQKRSADVRQKTCKSNKNRHLDQSRNLFS